VLLAAEMHDIVRLCFYNDKIHQRIKKAVLIVRIHQPTYSAKSASSGYAKPVPVERPKIITYSATRSKKENKKIKRERSKKSLSLPAGSPIIRLALLPYLGDWLQLGSQVSCLTVTLVATTF
jgi:hypothetical protein